MPSNATIQGGADQTPALPIFTEDEKAYRDFLYELSEEVRMRSRNHPDMERIANKIDRFIGSMP